MKICGACHLPHEGEPVIAINPCALAQAEAILNLLYNAGDPGTCRGCNALIYWITHRNGKKTPYTPAGLNHFIDCPAAKNFKRK